MRGEKELKELVKRMAEPLKNNISTIGWPTLQKAYKSLRLIEKSKSEKGTFSMDAVV